MKTESFVKKEIFQNSVESVNDLKQNSLESETLKEKSVSNWMKAIWTKMNHLEHHKFYFI